jgi:predicted MFS family arabinose efflux permease
VAVAAAGVALAQPVPLLFACALMLGVCCSLTLTAVQATLADRHGERRGVALSESNVVASLVTILGPLAIGGLQRAGIGWRGALFLPVIGLAVLAGLYHGERPPEATRRRQGTAAPDTRLPAAFWAFWVVVVLVVSIEWCVLVWGADYLESVVGLSKLNASTAMGVFLLAVLVGRLVGSRLARQLPGTTLLLITLGVTAVGFPIFWLARWAPLNLAGLFVAGLGIANLFPFTLAVALGLAPQQANTASARVSLGVGVAIFAAPLVLGWAADNLGLPMAYALVAALIVTALVVTGLARRVAERPVVAVPL